MRKRLIFLILCTVFVTVLHNTAFVYGEPAENKAQTQEVQQPVVEAQGAVLMDMDTGRVLWGKNMDKPMAMASTTKIMTAIIAIEKGNLEDIVVASSRAASAPKVKMNLAVGEEHTLKDLLYPLMLQSSNDAAVAIAEHVGGSVEEFCQMMTEKAKAIGAVDTVFVTPNGLDDGDHHSTPYDMALITRYALQNEEFIGIINTKEITIPKRGENSKSYTITNKNRLLYEYEGAIGVKTGFTGKAGQCFVGAAKRGDMTLISVVLASGWGTRGKEQKWRDSKALLNYGFEQYEPLTVIQKGDPIGTVPVTHSREGEIGLKLAEDVQTVVQEKEKADIRINIELPESLDAPVREGERIGMARVYIGDEICGESAVIAISSINRHDFPTALKKMIFGWLNLEDGIIERYRREEI